MSLLAGHVGGSGNLDGIGAAAAFAGARDVATDADGNVYVADRRNHSIRKISPAGVVSTFAGGAQPGYADGAGAVAQFSSPYGVAVDAAGNVYVADLGNANIRKISPQGEVSTFAGSTQRATGFADGAGTLALFNSPTDVAVDATGNVYVADSENHTIRKITSAGVVSTLAGSATVVGSLNGTGTAALFNRPYGVAVDATGNVYVADSFNHTIRKISPAGVVTTLAGSAGRRGNVDGAGATARFSEPENVAVDSAGNVYVTDFTAAIRKVSPAGVVTTFAGTAFENDSVDGTGSAARFSQKDGMAVDSAGNLLVADGFTIRKISPAAVVSTFAGSPDLSGTEDGTGAAARFFQPSGVASDSAGNVYVAEPGRHNIRKISPAGVVSTFAGTGGPGAVDGEGSVARFSSPYGVAVDANGNLYVADTDNHTIRKISPAGVVSTLAGSATLSGFADGIGAAARFSFPSSVAVDSNGNVYVADIGNRIVRKISPAGVVSTLAGSAGLSGSADGTGAVARFSAPSGVALDTAGNLYVADSSSETIRKISPQGVVSTLAGTADASGFADGTGAAARFNGPTSVAVDSTGNVYVADTLNHTIRKITPAGVVSTVVGKAGSVGVSLTALPASLYQPQGVAVSGGKLYITTQNGVVSTNAP